MLDMLCLTGEVGWARLSTGPTQVVGATPIALFLRDHATDWLHLRRPGPFGPGDTRTGPGAQGPAARESHDEIRSGAAVAVLTHLRARGASFAHELAAACGLDEDALRTALHELVAAGLVSSDGFAGLRTLVARPSPDGRRRAGGGLASAGRWSIVDAADSGLGARDSGLANGMSSRGASLSRGVGQAAEVGVSGVAKAEAVEMLAWTLLRRYGVIFRRLLAREGSGVPWRELARVYRRLEARGEIRGGRFVTGLSGEQFALPDAVDRLREIRRTPADDALVTISAADPLNFVGILTDGERSRTATSGRIVYHRGVAVSALEGDMLKALQPVDGHLAAAVAAAAAGRRVPVLSGFVGR
jgi:ATP-dependent Lhr-like helicase